MPTVRANFKNDKVYQAEKWLCPDCMVKRSPVLSPHSPVAGDQCDTDLVGELDTQEHLMKSCPTYSKQRQNTDFDNPKQCVDFFNFVVKKRQQA